MTNSQQAKLVEATLAGELKVCKNENVQGWKCRRAFLSWREDWRDNYCPECMATSFAAPEHARADARNAATEQKWLND